MSFQPPKERFKQYEKIACDFQIDRNIPIKRYFRSGVEMLRMADTYYNENNLEKAYILYHKYVTLFVEKIKLHPKYKNESKVEMVKVMKNLRLIMPRLEELKSTLNTRFEQDYLEMSAELEKRRAEMAVLETKLQRMKLEEEEMRLREDLNKYHNEKERALAHQRDREIAIWHQLKLDYEQSEQIRTQNEKMELPKNDITQPSSRPLIDRSSKPELAKGLPSEVPEIPSRTTKPSSALYTSGGLRTLHVPSMLMAKFISIADENTSANVETCGILAGKLSLNSFRITHLLIPTQKGTSDSCVTSGEEALFEYQDSNNLITLGWIHTHPTQTAFLSSVDLHTQLSYQLMLPEAVAIVMSPKFNETGFFVLTPNYGLDYIGNCRETGFHPHPQEPPLFEEGSHIEIDNEADVVVADLRN